MDEIRKAYKEKYGDVSENMLGIFFDGWKASAASLQAEVERLLKVSIRAEQAFCHLGNVELTGDARTIALNEARNIRAALRHQPDQDDVKQLRELLREVYNALDHRDSWLNLKPAIETALQAEVEQLKQNREIDAKHRGACHDQIDQLQAEVERLRETIKYYMDCTCEVISHPPCPKCVALTPQTDQEDK